MISTVDLEITTKESISIEYTTIGTELIIDNVDVDDLLDQIDDDDIREYAENELGMEEKNE